MNFKEELVSSFEDDTPCPVPAAQTLLLDTITGDMGDDAPCPVPAPTLLLTTLDTVTGDMGGTLGPHPGF